MKSLFCVRQFIEKYRKKKKNLYNMVFIDLVKQSAERGFKVGTNEKKKSQKCILM